MFPFIAVIPDRLVERIPFRESIFDSFFVKIKRLGDLACSDYSPPLEIRLIFDLGVKAGNNTHLHM